MASNGRSHLPKSNFWVRSDGISVLDAPQYESVLALVALD